MMSETASRDDIMTAAGFPGGEPKRDAQPDTTDDAPKRPTSVLHAQALALRAAMRASMYTVRRLAALAEIPPHVEIMLECSAAQLEAGLVQCDSFLTMAEAMSAMLPGARPQAPSASTDSPPVFGRPKPPGATTT